MKNSIYLRNISKRWKKEVSGSDDCIVLSPYVTSQTADNVLLSEKPQKVKLYTLFEAELFLANSSSLKTLRQLLNAGVEIYQLDNLHAKIVLAEDFVSIGSQNLTSRGRKNFEASYCSDDKQVIDYVRNELAVWIENASSVSELMISEMEKLIGPLKPMYKKLLEELFIVDDKVQQLSKENLLILEVEKRKLRNLEQIAKEAALATKSNWEIARVSYIESATSYTYSLVARYNLTSWIYKDQPVILQKKKRYLFIDTPTGRIAWARINKSRITFFSDGLHLQQPINLFGKRADVTYEANWDNNSEHNLKAMIKTTDGRNSIVLHCFFDIAGFGNISIEVKYNSNEIWLQNFMDLTKSDHVINELDELAKGFLHPFYYKTRLYGEQADKFFGSFDCSRKISLANVSGCNVLLSQLLD
ncbi:phospholipase D-like domain-containing protein [Pseudoalteromonas issachenkonii]|uniref:Phospholipase D-like domain-containing protein n=1 Tax=Pseudoalteromonas issachenkonii TaxID=152297 RepID=A0ABU9GVW2_9GAMM